MQTVDFYGLTYSSSKSQLERENSTLRRQLTELQAAHEDLEESFSSLSHSSGAEISSLKFDIAGAREREAELIRERDDARDIADERGERLESLEGEVEELRRAVETQVREGMKEEEEMRELVDEGVTSQDEDNQSPEDDDDADGETDGGHDGDSENQLEYQLIADMTVGAGVDANVESANQSSTTISTQDEGEDATAEMSFTGNLTTPPTASQSPGPRLISPTPSISKLPKSRPRPRSSSISSSSASILSSRRSSAIPSNMASFTSASPARGTLTTTDRHLLRTELARQRTYLLSLETSNARLTAELERLRGKAEGAEILKEEKRELDRKVERLESNLEEVLGELENAKKAESRARYTTITNS